MISTSRWHAKEESDMLDELQPRAFKFKYFFEKTNPREIDKETLRYD